MQILFTIHSQRHDPRFEMHRGDQVDYTESAARHEMILQALRESWPHDCRECNDHSLAAISRIHDSSYMEFLLGAWDMARSYGPCEQVLPHVWPARGLKNACPENFFGRLGYYSFDAGTPICAGTYEASVASANVAANAVQQVMDSQNCAFALCRPPGHHASRNLMGGYCYLNNVAIAAQLAIDHGTEKVAILDVDYHHGNGTQDIFYDRDDVLFVSIHADPDFAYPFFLGRAGEIGLGPGEGYNRNIPLPIGTKWPAYQVATQSALESIQQYSPDLLLVSFGADTHEADPISEFKLTTEDLGRLSNEIVQLGLPTLIVMEGGYALDVLGENVVTFLQGFDES